MYNRNICKFTAADCGRSLSVACFVLETDQTIMQRATALGENRILLVVEGTGYICADREKIDFSKGTLFFGFRNETLQFLCNGQCKYMYIDFDGDRAEELMKRFSVCRENRCFDKFEAMIPVWEESLLRATENTVDLAAESVVLYSFSRLTVDASRRNSTVNAILEITEAGFNRCDLSMAVIAEKLGYNAKYLSHLFKEKMHISYCEYLRCLRVKYAASLFDSGLDSVKNVAFLSGFSDPLYFSTVFKKVMGNSPKEYISGKN